MRTYARSIALLSALLATAGMAREAQALTACTAAQISSQDSGCPTGTGPCSITKDFTIGNGCVLDFGTRAVTLAGTGKLLIAPNSVTLKAGSFTVAPNGFIDGRGLAAPVDHGGFMTIQTTGAVAVQRSGSSIGRINVSGDAVGGTISIQAGGSVNISGDLHADKLSSLASGGSIVIVATGDVITTSTSSITAIGSKLGSGSVDFSAGGRIDLGETIDVSGDEGGSLDLSAGADVVVRRVRGDGTGDAGSGADVSILAGTSVQLLDQITLTGSTSIDGTFGGCGGSLDVEADFGNITVVSNLLVDGAGPDGGGGDLCLMAQGSVIIQGLGVVSAKSNGGLGCGGAIEIDADQNVQNSGLIDASGGLGGGSVDITATGDVTLDGQVTTRAFTDGGFGGDISIDAGFFGLGTLLARGVLDSRGGGCNDAQGCGFGGTVDLGGCDVNLTSTGQILAGANAGGANSFSAREQLTIAGPVDASGVGGTGLPGSNFLEFPSRKPAIVTGLVTPPPTIAARATCTAPGVPPLCLDPCPACGNGVVEYPEQCDTLGTPVSCDGCSKFCRNENCNDNSVCTADSCDPTLGCRHVAAPNGTSCSDGRNCNGAEVCNFGLCIAGTPINCSDGNPCTVDPCVEPGGCLHLPSLPGITCTDNNACTVGDVCDGNGACTPGATITCNDNNECTTDTCNTASGCVFTPRTGACTDDGNPCTNDVCASGSCTHPSKANGTACSDGQFCTVNESCQGGTCTGGTARNCADTNPCTADSCDETNDTCVNAPLPAGSSCSDNNACTVGDACDASGVCQPGTQRVCDDSNECTTDTCNPASGCVFTPRTGSCTDDGNQCTNDVCSAGVCTHPSRPNGTTCDDGLFCTVNDTCQGGTCTAGAPRTCADGNACTSDVCDETNDVCVNDPITPCCGNGVTETGEACDDANTVNTDACVNCQAARCGDGFVQTGVETCDLGAANSDAPNATCRTNCMPARCGDGILDTARGEQCDDGNTTPADGCSATCQFELPPTAELIGGRGSVLTDCALEFAMDRPIHDKNNLPSAKQTCRDGDPVCDHGTTPNECVFQIWLCANEHDVHFPLCTPGSGGSGVGTVAQVELKKPSDKDALRRPEDSQNRSRLLPAAVAAQFASLDFCGPRVDVRVPLKAPGKKGVKKIKLRGTTVSGIIDSDGLKLTCVP